MSQHSIFSVEYLKFFEQDYATRLPSKVGVRRSSRLNTTYMFFLVADFHMLAIHYDRTVEVEENTIGAV